MLANVVVFILTMSIETIMVLAWGIWIILNRNVENLTACPICGEYKQDADVFFFSTGIILWFFINTSLKVCSARSMTQFY